MLSKRDVYTAAMRLVAQHGGAAEIAAVLRGDELLYRDGDEPELRDAVLSAIADIRQPRSRH